MKYLSFLERDFFLVSFMRLSALLSGLMVLIILGFLVFESLPFIVCLEWISSFHQPGWYPTDGMFNLWPMLSGSLAVSFGSIFLAVPLGVFCALYTNFTSNLLFRKLIRRILELTAGIPSVIFGLWGLLNVVPFLSKIEAPGHSLLAGVIILSLMITPIIALGVDAAIQRAPKSWSINAELLGLSQSSYIWKVLLPALRPTCVSTFLLALGRAIGETMAVLMVCGNIVQMPNSFFAPIRTLTANIALEMAYAMGNHRVALFMSGLLLLLLAIVLVLTANNFGEKKSWKN